MNHKSERTVAIVTGGGRGLGRAYALALAAGDAAVAARTATEIQAVVHTIEQGGGQAPAITADVTNPAAMAQRVTAVERIPRVTL